jgi:hypothetical protein
VAAATALALSACVGPFSENTEHHYPNLAAARAADAIGEHRWIPAILPDEATAIREVHNIDTNLTWGCFMTRDMRGVRELLAKQNAQPTQAAVAVEPRERFRDFSWWPESMRSGAAEAWEFRESAACAACSPSLVRVGIDAKADRVCFHRIV